ncbi:hypothetical protein [Bradyrhizobium japonicum]|uniref:hypothetical protein n=1 Tax=Bradyrhizobium japonicum TaxID=375 RepID=UPI00126A69B9|nr:hypothetical protein [Bradyrhizobium japonicum]
MDDGTCGPGKIKKITGGSDFNMATGKPQKGVWSKQNLHQKTVDQSQRGRLVWRPLLLHSHVVVLVRLIIKRQLELRGYGDSAFNPNGS